jgi:hypothetical protein
MLTHILVLTFGLFSIGCHSDPSGPIGDTSVDAGDISDDADSMGGPPAEAALLGHPGKNYLTDVVRKSRREYYVVGQTDGPLLNGLETNGGWDGYIARVSFESRQSYWLKAVGDEGNQGLTSVATSPQGVWVGGVEYNDDQLPTGFVTSFNSQGEQGERIDLGSKGFNRVNNMTAGPDGSVIVAGSGGFSESASRTGRVGLISSDGTLEWQTTVSGDAQYSALDVAVSSDRIYGAGNYGAGNGRGSFVRAWNFEGERQLNLTIDSSGETGVGGIAVEGDRFYLAGQTTGELHGLVPRGDSAGYLLAYSKSGTLLWKDVVDSERAVSFTDLTLDNGRLTLAGWATARIAPVVEYGGSSDAIAVQYDLEGERLNVWQRGGDRDDVATGAISFGLEGRSVKVVAFSEGYMLSRNSVDPNGYTYREGESSRRAYDVAFVNEGNEGLDGLAFGPQDRLHAFGEASGDYGGGDPHAGRFSGLVARFDEGTDPVQKWAVDGENVIFNDGVVTEQAIFVGGHAYGGVDGYRNDMNWSHPVILRLSKSGDVTWVQDFSSSNAPLRQITGLEVTSNNSIAFIGNTYTVENNRAVDGTKDAFMGAVSNSDGTVTWQKSVAGPGRDELTGLATDDEGNLIVSGIFTESFGPLTVDADLDSGYVAKYDGHGNRQWIRQVEREGWHSAAFDVALGPDGGVYTAGLTTRTAEGWIPIGGDADGYVARFGPSGERTDMWQLTGTRVEYIEGLDVDANGSFAVVGHSFGSVGNASNAGGRDGFVGFKGPGQSSVSAYQVGSGELDIIDGVAFGPDGWLHITGTVAGSVWGLEYNGGEADALYARVPASRAVEALDELTSQ